MMDAEKAVTDEELTISGVVLRLKSKYSKHYSESAVLSWISKGRKKSGGQIRFLKSQQMGGFSPHSILASEVDDFINWLTS